MSYLVVNISSDRKNIRFCLFLVIAYRSHRCVINLKKKVKMIQAVWGEVWWGRKKRKLQDNLEEKRRNEEIDRLADSNRLEAMRQRRIKRKMGACKYFCWPCGRAEYDKMFPRANVIVVDPAKEEEERLRKVSLALFCVYYHPLPGL